MKRSIALLLSFAMLLSLLAACQPSVEDTVPTMDQPSVSTTPSEESSPAAPVEELTCANIVTGILRAMDMEGYIKESYGAEDEEPERLPAYLEESYGLSKGEWEDAYVARKGKSYGLEITVVRCADEDAAAHALDCLEEYRADRRDGFDTRKSGQTFEKYLMSDATAAYNPL